MWGFSMLSAGLCRGRPLRLIGANDLEVLADEYVVEPVAPDVVDFVYAVAQLHDSVDEIRAVRPSGPQSMTALPRRYAGSRPVSPIHFSQRWM